MPGPVAPKPAQKAAQPLAPSHTVVPFFTEEQKQKLAAYLTTLGSDSATTAKAEKLVAAQDHAGLLRLYAAESRHLVNAASEADMEAVYYLLTALQQQQPELFCELAATIAAPLEKSDAQTLAQTKIKVLTHVYNSLPVRAHARYDVYAAMLRFAIRAGQVPLLIPTLEHLETWLTRDWQATPVEQRAVHELWSDALAALDSRYYNLSYAERLLVLNTFVANGKATDAAGARPHALRCAVMALSTPTVLNFEDLVAHPAVAQSLSGDALLPVLRIFVDKDLAAWTAWQQTPGAAALLATHAIDASVLTHKMRLLTLASLCANALAQPPATVAYSQIAQALQIEMDQVEWWVIEAIRGNLIMARLDQLAQNLEVQRTTFRTFGTAQWRLLADSLRSWSNELGGIMQILDSARPSGGLGALGEVGFHAA